MVDLLNQRELETMISSAREQLATYEERLNYATLWNGELTNLDVPALSAFLESGLQNDALLSEQIGFEMMFKSVDENRPKFRSLTPTEWAREFVSRWFELLRQHICDDKIMEKAAQGKVTSATVAAALAGEVTSAVGVSSSLAVALVTAALLVIAKVSRGAFCSMTQEQVIEEISRLER